MCGNFNVRSKFINYLVVINAAICKAYPAAIPYSPAPPR